MGHWKPSLEVEYCTYLLFAEYRKIPWRCRTKLDLDFPQIYIKNKYSSSKPFSASMAFPKKLLTFPNGEIFLSSMGLGWEIDLLLLDQSIAGLFSSDLLILDCEFDLRNSAEIWFNLGSDLSFSFNFSSDRCFRLTCSWIKCGLSNNIEIASSRLFLLTSNAILASALANPNVKWWYHVYDWIHQFNFRIWWTFIILNLDLLT